MSVNQIFIRKEIIYIMYYHNLNKNQKTKHHLYFCGRGISSLWSHWNCLSLGGTKDQCKWGSHQEYLLRIPLTLTYRRDLKKPTWFKCLGWFPILKKPMNKKGEAHFPGNRPLSVSGLEERHWKHISVTEMEKRWKNEKWTSVEHSASRQLNSANL